MTTHDLVIIPAERARSNHAEVARTIGIDIISGRYPEGSKLPGDVELSLIFGVSRPVLREAAKTLVAKGLLSTKARVGTLVRARAAWNMFDPDVIAWHLDSGIDRRFLADLAEIRLAVEPRAAALAAQRRTPAALAGLEADLAAMRRAIHHSPGFAEADLKFHLAIADASGNPFMRSMGAVIGAALRTSFILSAPVEDGDWQATLAAHARIVEAVAAGEAEAAAAAMTDVIHNGINRQHAHTAAQASREPDRLTGASEASTPERG